MRPFELSSSEAADLLGVHAATINRWADAGRLPCWVTPGGHRRFRREDVEAFLRSAAPEDGEATA